MARETGVRSEKSFRESYSYLAFASNPQRMRDPLGLKSCKELECGDKWVFTSGSPDFTKEQLKEALEDYPSKGLEAFAHLFIKCEVHTEFFNDCSKGGSNCKCLTSHKSKSHPFEQPLRLLKYGHESAAFWFLNGILTGDNAIIDSGVKDFCEATAPEDEKIYCKPTALPGPITESGSKRRTSIDDNTKKPIPPPKPKHVGKFSLEDKWVVDEFGFDAWYSGRAKFGDDAAGGQP